MRCCVTCGTGLLEEINAYVNICHLWPQRTKRLWYRTRIFIILFYDVHSLLKHVSLNDDLPKTDDQRAKLSNSVAIVTVNIITHLLFEPLLIFSIRIITRL